MRHFSLAAPTIAFAAVTAMASVSWANEFETANAAGIVVDEARPDIIVELGLGAGMKPAYEGSTEYKFTLIPMIHPEYLYIPGLLELGGEKDQSGFSFAPSFEIIDERSSDDYEPLQGLDDVDTTYSLGGKVGYTLDLDAMFSAEVFGQVRYAFGGAEGFVGEAGANITARLTPQLEIVGGPSIAFASNDYMDTYFGVSPAESVATGGRLGTYDPQGGLKSVGVNLSARYEFVPDYFATVSASYTRLSGDAANSPIVQAGDQNQVLVSVGLSKRFSFDLY